MRADRTAATTAAMTNGTQANGGAAVPPGRRLARHLRALLAPHCTVCGLAADATPVCSGCRADFFGRVPRCVQCGLRLPHAAGSARCGRCLREQPAYDATVALADYVPPVDGLVVALKFGHRLELAALFGTLLGEQVAASVGGDAVLLPVPLAFERQAERGFNQAGEIARVVQATTRLPLRHDALLRTRHGAPQEALAADARRRNVRKAFAVAARAAPALAGRAVVVIDDVMTSGATLDEVARVLKQAGVARVVNAIVARTP
jgi:ComF family protein